MGWLRSERSSQWHRKGSVWVVQGSCVPLIRCLHTSRTWVRDVARIRIAIARAESLDFARMQFRDVVPPL